MTPNRSVSKQPESAPTNPGQHGRPGLPWPIALIFGGVILTLGWTAFLGWLVYATVVRTIG